MHREFLDLYNRELRLLYEQAKEFAEEYPGVAERLGGLTQERMDPMIAGLLEGAAFLAARVQLKLKHEFPQFTSNLLEQLLPHHLASHSGLTHLYLPAHIIPHLNSYPNRIHAVGTEAARTRNGLRTVISTSRAKLVWSWNGFPICEVPPARETVMS
jgi:hypothetical protein